MNSEQSYAGKGSSATSNPQKAQKGVKSSSTADNWADATSATVTFIDGHTIKVDNEFGSLMKDPIAMNWLRQDLRAWFMAYLPTREGSYVSSDLENSIQYFESLDQFFSDLVEAGINRQKGGFGHE